MTFNYKGLIQNQSIEHTKLTLNKEEFSETYGSTTNNENYINNLYENVLGRASDLYGFQYWLNQIEKGYEDRSELLLGFSESLENKSIFASETHIF